MIEWDNNINFKFKNKQDWEFFRKLVINYFGFDKLNEKGYEKVYENVYYDDFSTLNSYESSNLKIFYSIPHPDSNNKYKIIDINKLLRENKLKQILANETKI